VGILEQLNCTLHFADAHTLTGCVINAPKALTKLVETHEALRKLIASVLTCRHSDYPFIHVSADRVRYLLATIAVVDFCETRMAFDLTTVAGRTEFHRIIEMTEFIENIDAHSHTVWDERYGMLRNSRNSPTDISKAVIEQIVCAPWRRPFSLFHHEVEGFVAKCGINWINLQRTLLTPS
jgi:hypothetical protein